MECPMAKRPKLDETESQCSNDDTNSTTNDNDVPMNDVECDGLKEKLRQFDVLDEVEGDDSDSDGSGGE